MGSALAFWPDLTSMKIFSSLVLLSFASLLDGALEPVKKLSDIQSTSNLKNIQKLKNVHKLDKSLGEELKKQIETGQRLLNSVNTQMVNKISNPPPPGVSAEEHAKLLEKVQRVLDMFQVDDLDDILEAKEVDDNEGPEVEDVEVVPDGKEINNGLDESESELPLDEEECRKVIELKKKLGDASAVLADDIHDLPAECEQFQEEMGVEEVSNMEELEDVEELASAEDINEPLVTRITKHDDNKHRRVDKESVVLRPTDENVNLPPPPPPGLFDDIRQES